VKVSLSAELPSITMSATTTTDLVSIENASLEPTEFPDDLPDLQFEQLALPGVLTTFTPAIRCGPLVYVMIAEMKGFLSALAIAVPLTLVALALLLAFVGRG
jgi:hypothetical protein